MSKPSGVIYLCKNALVNRSYAHTIDFKDASEQNAYWRSLVKFELTDYSYIRKSSQCIRVEKYLDELDDVNYLFFRSAEGSKLYYCFVTDKEYVNDGLTNVYFEIDVLQTRMFEYEVKESYVLQEHCDRWNVDLKPNYSLTDEGLDYGQEYTVESAFKVEPQFEYTSGENPAQWYLAICKPGAIPEASGRNTIEVDKVGAYNPYIMFLLPEKPHNNNYAEYYQVYYKDSTGTTKQHTAVGSLNRFLECMAKTSLGNYVQQIVRLPYPPFEQTTKAVTNIISDTARYEITDFSNGDWNWHFLRLVNYTESDLRKNLARMNWNEGIKDSLPTDEQWAEVKANPYTTERDKRFESKLLCYPYRYNLLTDWRSTPVVIKNEYLGSINIILNWTQSLSFNAPARYWIEDYKKDPEGRASSLVQLVPEEAPVVTDAYYSYMLNNKNQIQADQTNAKVNAINSTIQGSLGVGGLTSAGGPWAAIAGAVVGGVGGGITNALNYQALIRSENAKQRDLKNLPDSIVNPNDSNFSVFDRNEYVSFYRYKICCEFEQMLADTFAITGYKVKQVKIPNLKTRVRYNYVKTIGANIVGSFNQNEINLIQQIFDNGVTFWHYNNVNFKPLDYSYENIETKLL